MAPNACVKEPWEKKTNGKPNVDYKLVSSTHQTNVLREEVLMMSNAEVRIVSCEEHRKVI